MRPLSFLVLTDHAGHSEHNSFYALVNTLRADRRCTRVDAISRGSPVNGRFFRAAEPRGQGITVKGKLTWHPSGKTFTEDTSSLDPNDYDVVWLRLPHPVPSSFFDRLKTLDALVVNAPSGIEETGDKSFLLRFPELTPPVRLVHSAAEARDFAERFPIVLKPLRAYGGAGIQRIDGPEAVDVGNFHPPYLAMKFLRKVTEGDKRILVVNGKVLAASLRLPAPGDWLCNVARGGRSVGSEVTAEEFRLIDRLAPELLRRGVCFAGIDTLVDDSGRRVLSEINTLSIGGFPQAEAQTGRPVLQQTIDELFSYCYDRIPA